MEKKNAFERLFYSQTHFNNPSIIIIIEVLGNFIQSKLLR